MPIAALCLTLAAGCSSDDAAETPAATTRPFTINASLGTGNANAGTRAGVDSTKHEVDKETFIWHEKDKFTTWMMTDAAGSNFNDITYKFAIKDYSDASPSGSASFECTTDDFPTENKEYKMVAVYPADGIFVRHPEHSIPALQCKIAVDQAQAEANSPRHLAKNMAMYAIATVGNGDTPTSLTFHHLTSLFRFTVTNKSASTCKITKIEVSSGTDVFGSGWNLDFRGGTMAQEPFTSSQKLTLGLGTSITGGNYSGFVLDTEKKFDGYLLTGPANVALTDQTLTFTLTVTDTDGQNERTYTSFALAANEIIKKNDNATTWEAGKRYWFNLTLDDQLNVKLNLVDNLPGWDNDTETEL